MESGAGETFAREVATDGASRTFESPRPMAYRPTS